MAAPPLQLLASSRQPSATVGFSDGSMGVLWSQSLVTADNRAYQLTYQRVDPSGQAVGTPVPLPVPGDARQLAAAALANDQIAVAWASNDSHSYAALVTRDGALAGPVTTTDFVDPVNEVEVAASALRHGSALLLATA
jgi:hypothetical protein